MKNNTYFYVTANNTVWVLNRITSLLRRRNYNIWEMDLTFDNNWYATILMWIDTSEIDAEQIASQIVKLYDVKDIEIVTDMRRIKKVFYVYSKDTNNFNSFSIKPDKIAHIPDNLVWIYILDFEVWKKFNEELKNSWLRFLEKVI